MIFGSVLPLALLVAQRALSATVTPAKRSYGTHDYYVLQHDPSGPASIHDCAGSLDVELVEQVGELADHWLVRTPTLDAAKRSEQPPADRVLERFEALRRSLSSSTHSVQSRSLHERRIARSVRSLDRQVPRQRTKKRAPIPEYEDDEERAPVPPGTKSEKIAALLGINDPIFTDQWHLSNSPQPTFDLNVSGVWAQGVTGKGVYTAVVDDGLDANSDDLADNFYAPGSWDFNDHTNLPLPRLNDDQHGTRCSGEIAAVKNDVCGMGVAYEAKISGIRILSGPISDADEAASLNYRYNETSVYSCSWGPPDDGRSMEAPSLLIKKAVVNGIQNGRGGKGSIFVFASGNGAGSGDQCNFDGYTNSIYSVTVAAVDHMGKHPYYSEPCAANMIVAYSSGGGNRIYTTDVGKNKCTSAHGGTSAAAPLGAGVIALGLQVRPELTWRDVQYICMLTAQQLNPEDPDWEKTAVGRPYSYKYGYGALDAWTFVELARTWKLVKKQAWVDLPQVELPGAEITAEGVMTGGEFIRPGGLESKINVNQSMLSSNNFETLEHITVKVWIHHARRGDVEVDIISPNGIKSVLAVNRRFDDHTTGYPGWQFMSVKHWGENPLGDWTLKVRDMETPNQNGSFLGWSLTLWGEGIDNDKAKLWTFPEDEVLPEEGVATHTTSATPTISATTSTDADKTTRPKPTDGLPDDHDIQHGDVENPAFPVTASTTITSAAEAASTTSSTSTSSTHSATPSVTPDEGYFSHAGDLLKSNTWLFAAIALVSIFAIAGGLFFWRRRVRRRGGSDDYAAVDGEDMPMRTKELYNAFGEPEDDDYDDAEHGEGDRLISRGAGPSSSTHQLPDAGLRYHDDFLEDEHSPSAQHSPRGGDKDELLVEPHDKVVDLRSASPSGGSGDSWEHADAPR